MSANSDPFARYRPKQEQSDDPFAAYRQKEQEQEPNRGAIGFELSPVDRQFNRLAAEGVERVLSAPRAVGDFLQQLVPEKALKAGASKIGLGEGAEALIEGVKKYSPHKLFPTKEQAHGLTKKIFGEQLEPKNEAERISQEMFGDFIDLALPGSIGKGAKLLRPALTSIGANLAKEGVGLAGGSESQKEWAKLGVLGISAFIHPKAAENYYNKQFNLAREARPKGATVRSPRLTQDVNTIEQELQRGGSETWKTKLQTKLNEIKGSLSGDYIEVEDLEAYKRSLNNIISELFAERNVGKTGIKSARRYVNKIAKSIDGALTDYGKVNPTWESYYRPANEAFGAVQQSKKASNWIMKNIKKLGLSHAGATALMTYLAGPAGLVKGAAAAAATVPTIKVAETITQIFKSPKLRKNFFDLYKGAVAENATAASRAAKELEKEID